MGATVEFTDDTTTVTARVISGQWSPALSRRNPGITGPRFVDVRETMGLVITGEDGAALRQSLTNFSLLMDQANKWYQDEPVSAVKVRVKMDDSDTTVEAVMWDTEIRQPSNLLDISPHETKAGRRSDPFRLSFMRRGQWLDINTEAESDSTSTGNPALFTSSTFSESADIPSPFDVDIQAILGVADVLSYQDIYMFFSDQADKIYYIEAESQTLGTDVSSQSPSGASGGNVARFDCSNDTAEKTVTDGTTGLDSTASRLAVWAVLRNRSPSTVSWDVWGRAYTLSSYTGEYHEGRKTTIAAGDNNIQAVFLGIFILPTAINKFVFVAQNDVTGTVTTDDLEVDYIVGLALDDNAGIIYYPGLLPSGYSVDDVEFHIDHRLNSHITPLVYNTGAGGGTVYDYPSYVGDAPFMCEGDSISCLVWGYGLVSTLKWTITHAGTSETSLTFDVTRTRAYLTAP